MAKAKNFIPEGMHTITPHLAVKGATQAIEFYKKALGATLVSNFSGPGGTVMHAELKIGDSVFYLNDEFPDMGAKSPQTIGGSPVTIHLFVRDCDALYNQALAAGAKSTMPIDDMFWGDRYGQIVDPFGHVWSIATHKEDLTPQELAERGKQAMAQMGQK